MTEATPRQKRTRVRYVIVLMLFVASCCSYGDRAALSVAATVMQKALAIDPEKMGILFSGFGWAYVFGQLPAGGLLDRFGSKRVYGISILSWSVVAFLVGSAGYLGAAWAFTAIFLLRLLSGLAQSPVFPGNGRIVAAWFPTAERGRASAIFNASQYFALVVFAPLFGWLTHAYGWRSCFWFMGIFGFALAFVWSKVVYGVKDHPRISQAELDCIEQGGGLVNMDCGAMAKPVANPLTWEGVRYLLRQRMLIGIYIGQFCINTLTTFFLTWFPSYLVMARHMTIVHAGFAAALPALCGSVGGILGGVLSDRLLRTGHSLSFSRKAPIVAGMLLSVTMIGCNYVSAQWVVMLFMSLAFFGKGFGALGWTVIADTSPKTLIGVNGGLFNMFGNLAAISTPIAIGYILTWTGSFDGVLIFIAVMALLAIVAFLPIVGEIKRVDLKLPEAA